MRYALVVVLAAAGLAVSACGGGDDAEEKRVAAAEWCEVTAEFEREFVAYGTVPWDRASDWVDAAPEDIRDQTDRAARILREVPLKQPEAELREARIDIAEYAADYCAQPTPCIADVETYPKFPCVGWNRSTASRD
jgi:hypothetical protein